jgi:hypothetical protein
VVCEENKARRSSDDTCTGGKHGVLKLSSAFFKEDVFPSYFYNPSSLYFRVSPVACRCRSAQSTQLLCIGTVGLYCPSVILS